MKWLRRIRGAIGLGLIWALGWSGMGVLLVLGVVLVTGTRPDPPVPMMFGVAGLLGGMTFSGVVSILEGRRRFAEMSLPRFAVWGAVAGFLLATAFVLTVAAGGDPTFVRYLIGVGPALAAAGAGSAAGTLALARRAEEPDLLEAGEDMESPSRLR